MIHLMVFGHPDDLSETQYTIYDAATAVGYRRRLRVISRPLPCSSLFTRFASNRVRLFLGNVGADVAVNVGLGQVVTPGCVIRLSDEPGHRRPRRGRGLRR
jgi:hypothetical protein